MDRWSLISLCAALGRCRLLTRPRLLQSPQTNIVEALLFSAKLRINGDIDRETLEAYVDEVMGPGRAVCHPRRHCESLFLCSADSSATAAIAKHSQNLLCNMHRQQLRSEALTDGFRWACRE